MEKEITYFEYSVEANQGQNRIRQIVTPEVSVTLESATPPEFPNGIPGYWSPETFFLAAVAGCFVNTYQVLADKFGFKPAGFSCEASGKVAFVDGKYGFTEITITPKITLESAEQEATAAKVAEKAHKYCLISNSVKCPVLMAEKMVFKVLEVA